MKKNKTKYRFIFAKTIKTIWAKWASYALLCAIIFVPVAAYRSLYDSPVVDFAYTFIMYTLNLFGFLLAFRAVDYKNNPWSHFNQFISTTALKLPQFFAVSLAQLMAGVPLFLGVFFLLQAVVYGWAGWWLWPMGTFAFGLSVYFLVRWSLAGAIVVRSESTSITALRQSYRLTCKHFWRTFGRLILFFVIIVLISGVIFQLLSMIGSVGQNKIVNGLVSGLLISVIAPLYARYLSDISTEYGEQK